MSVKGFLDIYNKSFKIGDIKPINDSNYKIFRLKDNLPVAIVDTRNKKLLYEITGVNNCYYEFINKHNIFWLLPVETIDNSICGFILRCFKENKAFYQKYSICKNADTIPLVFGWYDFKDYNINDPIILTESAKDAIVIKSIYKYTLSLNTASIKEEMLCVLKRFTNNIILVLDNDITGIKNTQISKKLLVDNGFKVRDIKITMVKDVSELYFNYTLFNVFKTKLLEMLNKKHLTNSTL